MYMWYWAIMVLLILGSIALLCSTFISVKKNKAQDAERRKQSKKGKRNNAVQGRTVLWIQRSVLLKREDSGRLSWKIWIHGRSIASYSMTK